MSKPATIQNHILSLLIEFNKPMFLKQICNNSQFGYRQVASCITALRLKGYVRRVRKGLYEVTEEAKLIQLPPEIQIKILKQTIEELQNEIKSLLTQLSNK